MKLYRYVDHQRLHIVTKDVISLSISVLLLFRHYISHKITFGAPSSGGVLRSACGAFILVVQPYRNSNNPSNYSTPHSGVLLQIKLPTVVFRDLLKKATWPGILHYFKG